MKKSVFDMKKCGQPIYYKQSIFDMNMSIFDMEKYN
jgi:hypothetical protein